MRINKKFGVLQHVNCGQVIWSAWSTYCAGEFSFKMSKGTSYNVMLIYICPLKLVSKAICSLSPTKWRFLSSDDMIPCVPTYAHEWRMLTFMMPSLTVSPASFVTSVTDNKFGLPGRCYRSHWHNSIFLGYLLSSFFLSLTHFYLLVVGIEVILALDHTQWHSHTR